MKRLVIRVLSSLFQLVNRIAVRIGIIPPKVIIYMDGGICSQMSMYLKGQYYKDVADVFYDTTWFELNGKDLDGRFDRKLELTEFFPSLPFATINRKKSRLYKMFFSYSHIDGYLPEPSTIKRTTYFGGYFDLKSDDMNRLFSLCFSEERRRRFDVQSLNYHLSCKERKVAVHVRRGDLVNREYQWYKNVPVSYFLNAITYVEDRYPDSQLFFFSDEPDYVEQSICPHITTMPYQIVSGNKAYEDLFLISLCDIVIASQGSFGRWGARLNGHSVLIIPSDRNEGGFEIVPPVL